MLSPKIIIKNRDYLILNKPAGLLVHRARVSNIQYLASKEPTLTDWLLKNYPQVNKVGDDPVNRPGIVHRLDKETSGIMIVPLNIKSFDYFKKLFQNHQIKKTYIALVYGNIKSDNFIIDKPIGIKSGTTRRTVHSAKMAKEAVTEFEVVKRFIKGNQHFTLVKAYPKTGRTHQIRVHLAYIRCPVVGDKLYGPKKNVLPNIDRQLLHAESIEFVDAKGKTQKFKAPLPKEFKSLI